jgi:hypothetical protein
LIEDEAVLGWSARHAEFLNAIHDQDGGDFAFS